MTVGIEPVRDFDFPSAEPLPFHDRNAGIALGKAGMRGTYLGGVVHALVVCGYYPGTVAGTSAGCIAGSVLALAGEMDAQARRLSFVSEHLDAWFKNPGEDLLSRLVDGPFGRLVSDLVDIDLPVGAVVDAVRAAVDGRSLALARVLWEVRGLALARPVNERLRKALVDAAAAAAGALRDHERLVAAAGGRSGASESLWEDIVLRFGQQILTAYGMRQALLEKGVVDTHFGEVIARYAPSGQATRFDQIKNTQLIFQVANLSRSDEGGGTRLELIAPRPIGARDLSGANLLAALRASCAVAPLFPGVRMGDLFSRAPGGLDAADLLMDAAAVEKDPLSPALSHWARQPRSSDTPYRLFAVYHEPTGEVRAPVGISLLRPALHSLQLWGRLDQQYTSRVIEMMTDMVEAIEEAGVELPPRVSEGRYVPVRITDIAPREMLPFAAVSAPREEELRAACATGCRSTLEVLHAPTVRRLSVDGSAACRAVLDAARAAHTGGTSDGSPLTDYFKPLDAVCAHCPGQLFSSDPRAGRPDPRAPAKVNDFAPFHEGARRGRDNIGPPKPITAIVPAGGVFLGAFQIGAIAALKDYELKPELYAGASVGTIFSYLLDTCLDREAALAEVVEIVRTVPAWVDALSAQPEHAGAGGVASALRSLARQLGLGRKDAPPGLVDKIRLTLVERWRSEAVRPLRALTPREIVDVFAAPTLATPADELRWTQLQAGIAALFFTPATSRRTGAQRTLAAMYTREPNDRVKLRQLFLDLVRVRLHDALAPLDAIAANLDCFEPDDRPETGEIIGFDNIQARVSEIVFGGRKRTLKEHSKDRQVRFLFTVTNLTRGVLEYFGYDDELTPEQPSPDAVQACLAASSFPLAFRTRSREETFGGGVGVGGSDRFADGGIFNNFPSDTAFSYLRALSAREATRWIGAVPHRVILLSLSSPVLRSQAGAAGSEHGGVLFALKRAYVISEAEKVEKTLRLQEHINALAEVANPLLRWQGEPQAILADMDLISPAYAIYKHPFAFKSYFGFKEEKQLEMVASGCRRTRIALEWREYQAAHGRRGDGRERLEPRFMAMIRGEVDGMRREDPGHKRGLCMFKRHDADQAPARCTFLQEPKSPGVYARCWETVDEEILIPDWKLQRRVRPGGGANKGDTIARVDRRAAPVEVQLFDGSRPKDPGNLS